MFSTEKLQEASGYKKFICFIITLIERIRKMRILFLYHRKVLPMISFLS